MKIFVGIPTIGLIHSDSAHSIMEFIADITRMEKDGFEFVLGVMPRMLVAQARELAIEEALKLKCDYLFMTDDDMILPRGIMKRLLSHKKEIVGAMSFERLGENKPNIYKMVKEVKESNGQETPLISLKWENIVDYDELPSQDGLMRVDVIGFGVVLINLDICRGENAIETPYFMSQFQVGEDFFFCWKAYGKEREVWADTNPLWQAGHIGPNVILTERIFKDIRTQKKVSENLKTLQVVQC